MISYNTLSTFILHHDINRLCDKNICSIQDLMRTSNPDSDKFKRVCEDFPNLAILTNCATLGEVQMTFAHAPVGKIPSGNPLLPSSSRCRLRHNQLSPYTLILPLPLPETIFVSLSPRYSFAPPSETSLYQRNRGPGWR